MGVIEFFCKASSLCVDRPIAGSGCGTFQGNFGRSRVTFMAPPASSSAAAVPLTEDSPKEGGGKLTGDSFIRPHLRKLSPYQPILPFEVISGPIAALLFCCYLLCMSMYRT